MVGEVRANRNTLTTSRDDWEFRQLAENLPILCWIADADGYIVWYNRQWYDYTGATPEQMQGWGWQSVHDPRSLAVVLERWAAAIASAKPFEMVFPIRGADGRFRPFLTRINPFFDEHGVLTRWFGVNTDISLQVEAQEAVAQSDTRFRILADAAPQLIWSARADGYCDYFNARWYEYTGAPIGSCDGDGWLALIHPDDVDRARAAWRQTVEIGDQPPVEVRLRRASGRFGWILSRATAERDAAGQISRWYGTCADIDDIVEARARLQQSRDGLQVEVAARTGERDLLATIVETTDVMIMAIDRDYRILAINKANADEFERVYGVRPQVGDDILSLLASQPEQQAAVRETWGRALAGEEATLIEPHGDPGRARPFYEIKFRSLRDADGGQIGAFQFVQDVTERLRDQARLAEAQAALVQSQKLEAMGQLTGGVAHDFNNLLTPIIGSLDLLRRRGLGGEREERLIQAAYQSAERAKLLVQRLLAFARRQPLQATTIDVGALVRGLTDLVSSTVGPQVSVTVETTPGRLSAKADPNQLEMAIINLCVNARDAMVGGGFIGVHAAPQTVAAADAGELAPGRYIRVSVSDTGCGMDEATRARAVEPFFSTKGVGKGTGLGLSMVHGLAAQLGGALTIASEPGRGTEVSIWLPATEEPAVSTATLAAPSGALGGGDALLVDDEDFIRLSIADMLADMGFTVHEASSAEAALQAIDAGLRPDVLITDHLMPGMTGVQLAHAVQLLRPSTKVLIVSGFAEVEGIDPALPRLTKPFVQSDLAKAMADLQLR
jgi:PAS domain S-box-containing protein